MALSDSSSQSPATSHYPDPTSPTKPANPTHAPSSHSIPAPGADPDHDQDHDHDDPNSKKQRACEACRGLKVKCEPLPANPDGPCKRCSKAGRSCVVTQPTRKRQKKTDSRVAELEKKIDALTATLTASRGGPSNLMTAPTTMAQQRSPGDSDGGSPHVGHVTERSASASAGSGPSPWSGPPAQQQQQQAPSQQSLGRGMGIGDAMIHPAILTSPPNTTTTTKTNKRKHDPFSSTGPASSPHLPLPSASAIMSGGLPTGPPRPPRDPAQQVADVIDRNIVTMAQATDLYARYTQQMAPHLPMVILPPEMTASRLRKQSPYLFLAILAAAASEMPDVQRVLVREFTQLIADKVVVIGEKSMELIQSILVGVIWYFPPEHFEELKFYQFVHLAAVMAIDIGLGKRKANAKSRLIPYTWRDHPFRKSPLPDPTSVESRRTWLGCYFLASNVSMALHRPNLIRWTGFMQECLEVLGTGKDPDGTPVEGVAETDRILCHLVWTHRLAEEIGVQFSMDDPSVHVDVSEPKVQYALKGFERDLVKYRDAIPLSERKPSLILAFHVISLYMHEIALYVDKNDEFRPPLNADALRDPIPALNDKLTSAHVSALSNCLTAIDGIFETFLAMDASTIRCLPIFNFVRVAYAVVVLIKMYFSASSPTSELGRVFNTEGMKVQSYLDRLLEKFKETAVDDRSRPAGKFLVVLMMLSGWFRKQEAAAKGETVVVDGLPAAGSGQQQTQQQQQQQQQGFQQPQTQPHQTSSGQWHQQQHHQQQSQYQQQPTRRSADFTQASTPLHLLSEVATGGDAHRSSSLGADRMDFTPHSQASWSTPPSTGGEIPQQQQPSGLVGPGQQAMPWLPASAAGGGGLGGGNTAGNQNPNILAATGINWADLDYSALSVPDGLAGSGLEQAMGISLTGFGDLDMESMGMAVGMMGSGMVPGTGLGLGGGMGGVGGLGMSEEEQERAMVEQMRFQMAAGAGAGNINAVLGDRGGGSRGGGSGGQGGGGMRGRQGQGQGQNQGQNQGWGYQ